MTAPLLALAALSSVFASAGVRVEFDPTRPQTGPYPNDYLTVADESQRTGRRVNLPAAACTGAADCQELALLNQLDGFSLNARATVKFSGAVNAATLGDGVFYLWLDPVWPRERSTGSTGELTPINQSAYDPATNTLYAKPDRQLEQGRRFALIVTDAVLDAGGEPVHADEGFRACLDRAIGGWYCELVSDAVRRAESSLSGRRVVGASVFTTMSGSAFVEAARDALRLTSTGFLRGPSYNLADLKTISVHLQTGANAFADQDFPGGVPFLLQAGVARVAFATISSPRFLNASQFIPQLPTAAPVAPPDTSDTLAFHVFLPAAPAPPGGYPVLLAGHGIGDNRYGIPTLLAANFVSRGYAVVAMNAVGHGGGPQTTLRLTPNSGATVEIPAPGRGVDIDGDGSFGAFEGCVILYPGAPYGIRDCMRQTALDYVQLVRAIQLGVDLDGDGKPDLNPAAISYFGMSLGSFYGSILTAVEPAVGAAALNTGGGNTVTTARFSPALRFLLTLYLAFRQPPLLNQGLGFDEQVPLRYAGLGLVTKPNVPEIQDVLERLEWLETSGAPATFAPHWKWAPLDRMPYKRVLLQLAYGDMTVPNPSNSMLVRAANLSENSVLYRHDLARETAPDLPANSHTFLAFLDGPYQQAISFAAIQQGLAFLASGTEAVPDVNPLVRPLFGRDLFQSLAPIPPESPNFTRP